MTLKVCACGRMNTTKNAKFIGRAELGCEYLMFNCKCGSSFSVLKRADRERLLNERKRAA